MINRLRPGSVRIGQGRRRTGDGLLADRVAVQRGGGEGLLTLGTAGLGLIAAWALLWRDSGPLPAFVGLVLVMLALALAGRAHLARHRADLTGLHAFHLMADDPAACFMTDAAGHVILRNLAAETRFGTEVRSLHEALARHVLHPAEWLLRLQGAADADGAAREDVPGQDALLRLTVHRAGRDSYFWRADDIALPQDSSALIDRMDRPPAVAVGSDLEEVPVAIMTFGPDGVMRIANYAARELMWRGATPAARKCCACGARRSVSSRSPCAAMTRVGVSARSRS